MNIKEKIAYLENLDQLLAHIDAQVKTLTRWVEGDNGNHYRMELDAWKTLREKAEKALMI